MKVSIRKDQAKKLIGGVSFELYVQAQLTPQEQDLVKRYKAYKQLLYEKELRIPFTKKCFVLNINIQSLIDGVSYKCSDIAEIIEHEEALKEACESFYNYIQVMKEFGGEEILEFPLTEKPAVPPPKPSNPKPYQDGDHLVI